MDRWSKALTLWAGFLAFAVVLAAAAQDDPDAEPYAPGADYAAPADEPTSPATGPSGTEPARDGTRNASGPSLEDSYHSAQTNVSATGSGTWSTAVSINATGVTNLTLRVTYEPRDGQASWHATFAEFRLVDPHGDMQWRGGATGIDGSPGNPTYSHRIPGDDVTDGPWTFTFTWDGPTDVRIILEAVAERATPPG